MGRNKDRLRRRKRCYYTFPEGRVQSCIDDGHLLLTLLRCFKVWGCHGIAWRVSQNRTF